MQWPYWSQVDLGLCYTCLEDDLRDLHLYSMKLKMTKVIMDLMMVGSRMHVLTGSRPCEAALLKSNSYLVVATSVFFRED